METSMEEGKGFMEVPEMDEEGEYDEYAGEDSKKKGAVTPSKRRAFAAGGSSQRSCQAEDCTADMADAKPYHRRHKVCEFHAKAAVVLLSGSRQRFCQQCSSMSGKQRGLAEPEVPLESLPGWSAAAVSSMAGNRWHKFSSVDLISGDIAASIT